MCIHFNGTPVHVTENIWIFTYYGNILKYWSIREKDNSLNTWNKSISLKLLSTQNIRILCKTFIWCTKKSKTTIFKKNEFYKAERGVMKGQYSEVKLDKKMKLAAK